MIHNASRRSPRAPVLPPACSLSAMPSQWTDLPLDILRLVADRLPATADYLRLMSVTPSWCSALQKPDAVAQRLRWAGVSERTIDAMSPPDRLKRLSRLGLVEGNLDHGRYQMRAFHTHETNCFVATFSHDSTRVLTFSEDHTPQVWTVAQPDRPFLLRGQTSEPTSVAFSHDDTRVAIATYGGTVRVWTLAQPDSPLVLTHAGHVYQATFSYDDTCVLTTSDNGTVRLYDFAVSIPRTNKTDTCSQQNKNIELKIRPFGLRSLSPRWFLRFATHLQNSKLSAALPLHVRKRILKPIARLSPKTTG